MKRLHFMLHVYLFQVNTKHLYNFCTMLNQRRRYWADNVQLYANVLCLLG